MSRSVFAALPRTILTTLVLALSVSLGWAQEEPQPGADFVLAGYGSADYGGVFADEYQHDFTASVSPIMLFQMGSDFLFEAELEFGLSGELTTTTLEYAQIDYLGFERFQVVAGKFLLPFGLFSKRYHPTWINKLPTTSLLYGHAHGGVAEGALLPIMSDAGLMVQTKQPLSDGLDLQAVVWATQGPVAIAHEEESGEDGAAGGGHTHAVAPPGGSATDTPPRVQPAMRAPGIATNPVRVAQVGPAEVPDVGFGVAFTDNNQNKMVGARVGVVSGSSFEIYGSGFHAMYDANNYLDLTGFNAAFAARPGPVELRGEGILLRQELEHEDGVFETLDRWGYYLQVSRRSGSIEPVVRWSHLPQVDLEDQTVRSEKRRLAIGTNYWLAPSIPLKLSYSINMDGNDALYLQWAYGF